VREQLSRILQSQTFNSAPVLSQMLRYVVDRTLEGRTDELKEYSLGVDVFGRGTSFDPRVDTIVRVQARRLRSKLEEYYNIEGRIDPVLLELPKGRYIASFRPVPPAPAGPPTSESTVDPSVLPVGERFGPSRRQVLLGGVAVLGVLTLAWVLHGEYSPKGPKHPRIKSLAVLPLKNLSGDPSQEYFADGMTEAIIGRLSAIHDLRVISRTSVMSFKDTKLSVPEIAGKLHVDALVEGSVIRDGNRVRVHAQLIRGATDEHFWSEAYDRELQDVLALQTDVAQSIATKIEVTISGEERERLTAVRSVSPEVYENYLKGELGNINTRADIEQSVAYYEQAIAKDPTFAPAYVGLAIAYDHLGDFERVPADEVRPKEISAARKALELDPGLATPHAYLADTYQQQWQWAEAEAEYKRALELNPNDAAAHLGFANWLLCQGRTEEALTWSERARALDPVGVTGLSNGWILFSARRYNDAIRELRSVIVVHPDYATAHWFLGFALMATGQLDEAIAALKKAASLSDDSSALLGTLVRAYAQAGNRKEARKLLDELRRRQQEGYVPAAAFVEAYLGLAETDRAFTWLERAYQEHSIIMQVLKVDPPFDPIRRDPRFVDLVRRVGLN
jgi:pentatricopeptide repeat protein